MRYSSLALLRGALTSHRHWQPAWTSPQPRSAYDVVIVGAGGHGLAAGGSTPAALGEARRARLADVPVLVVCARPAETLLVVDRAYAEHLRGWIDATLADWKDE